MTDSEKSIRIELVGQAMLIELNRPTRGNALSADLVEALIAAMEEADRNPAIDTVVFRGGGRHFCTGFDLDRIEDADDAGLLLRFVRIETLLNMVWTSRLRTVAIGMGRVWGAGADLFVACDVRIAGPDARFCFPGAGFGIVLGTRRLSARVGRDKARQWTTTGMEVPAATGLDSGLVTQTVEEAVSGAELIGRLSSLAVDADTLTGLNQASLETDGDRDLALLVRSASRPGLKGRIVEYAARRRANRA